MVASASDAGFDYTVETFEPRLCWRRSPFPGNGIPRARDDSPEIPSWTELVSNRDRTATAKPANWGAFGSCQEISGFARMRGGGCSPHRTGLWGQNSLITGKMQGIFAKCKESGHATLRKSTARSAGYSQFPYTVKQGIFPLRTRNVGAVGREIWNLEIHGPRTPPAPAAHRSPSTVSDSQRISHRPNSRT